MKPGFTKKVMFAGKSFLWSVALYLICMLAINWQDVTASFRKHPDSYRDGMQVVKSAIALPGPAAATVATISPAPQTNIAIHTSIITKVEDALVALGKIASFANKY